jgi:serine/threonine protein kinase
MFGVGGCNIRSNQPQEVTEAACSIAKLHKLREAELEGPITDKFIMEWAIAEDILSHNSIQTLTVREELIQRHISLDCIAFIEHLLVVDPKQRPSATEALAHPFLKD